jgi:hypothetical protein
MSCGEIDFRVFALKEHHKPSLALTPPTPTPGLLRQILGQIVIEPVATLCDNLGIVGSDLLLQLTESSLFRSLTVINAALWHLPSLSWYVIAPRDENLGSRVDEHDSHTAAVFSGIDILISSLAATSFFWLSARIAELNRNAFQHIQKRTFINVIGAHQQADLGVGKKHDEVWIAGPCLPA